jgi:hypothetical protein
MRLILGLIKRLFRSCEIVQMENRATKQNVKIDWSVKKTTEKAN